MKTHLGIALMMLAAFAASVCGADLPAQDAKDASWGNVRGQVVLAAKLDDPRLQKFFEDLPINIPLTLKDVKAGVIAQVLSQIPNEQLIVEAESKGVKNALVYVKSCPKSIHPDYAKQPLVPVELKLEDRQFRPRIFSMQVGQTLAMSADKRNGEPTNFLGDFLRNDNFNVLVAPNKPDFKWTPKQPESPPRIIQSSIYTTAKAFLIIQDHPYMTVTDYKGRFELKNLPVGTHELIIWHETVGYIAKNVVVEIKPKETFALKPLAITAEQLLK
jgi:hypothetical protein